MAFCRKCGEAIDDEAVVCPYCKAPQMVRAEVSDDGGFLWGLLGFLVPVAGLVLFLDWKDSRPKTARAVGMGALVIGLIGALWFEFVLGVTLSAILHNIAFQLAHLQ